METIRLKGIDLPVSRLCAGGCPAGEYGWGQVDHDQIEGALRRAFESVSYTHLDVYKRQGYPHRGLFAL